MGQHLEIDLLRNILSPTKNIKHNFRRRKAEVDLFLNNSHLFSGDFKPNIIIGNKSQKLGDFRE